MWDWFQLSSSRQNDEPLTQRFWFSLPSRAIQGSLRICGNTSFHEITKEYD